MEFPRHNYELFIIIKFYLCHNITSYTMYETMPKFPISIYPVQHPIIYSDSKTKNKSDDPPGVSTNPRDPIKEQEQDMSESYSFLPLLLIPAIAGGAYLFMR